MIDYHIHLENGPLTIDWLSEFWQIAEAKGITEIGISEHCHKFKEFYPTFQYLTEGQDSFDYMKDWISKDFRQSLEDYIDLLLEARSKGIPVKIGIEVDYLTETEDLIKEIIGKYPFDYVIGSVHVIGKWGFDYFPQAWERQNINEAYRNYYATLTEAVNSGLFDIIGHFDVIKVFGHRSTLDLTAAINQTLQAIDQQGACLEISSAGLRKPVGEIYPAVDILRQAYQMQIPITIGSDAHYPEDVGDNWERLVFIARSVGYRECRIFEKRQAYAKKLPKL